MRFMRQGSAINATRRARRVYAVTRITTYGDVISRDNIFPHVSLSSIHTQT